MFEAFLEFFTSKKVGVSFGSLLIFFGKKRGRSPFLLKQLKDQAWRLIGLRQQGHSYLLLNLSFN